MWLLDRSVRQVCWTVMGMQVMSGALHATWDERGDEAARVGGTRHGDGACGRWTGVVDGVSELGSKWMQAVGGIPHGLDEVTWWSWLVGWDKEWAMYCGVGAVYWTMT